MYLGVENSISNRRWVGPPLVVERQALNLNQQTDLPLQLCHVIARLGVTPEHANDFLNPTLRATMSDPKTLKDCTLAAEIILDVVQAGKNIAIFADYDVDGGA